MANWFNKIKRIKNNNVEISKIMKASGLSKNEVKSRYKKACNQMPVSLTLRDFRKYKIWSVSEKDYYRQYRNELRKHNRRETLLKEIADLRNITKEQARCDAKKDIKKYGLTYGQYKNYEFWNVPKDEKFEIANTIVADYAEKKRVKEIEKEATAARIKFVTSNVINKVKEKNVADDIIPDNIKVASYLIGISLPNSYHIETQNEETRVVDASFDGIQKKIGEKLLPKTADSVDEYDAFRKAFYKNKAVEHTETNLAIFYVDWLLFAKDYGFNASDYFEYRFFNKDVKLRNSFLSQGYRGYVRDVCNTHIGLFKDKMRFNEFFGSLIRREWMKVTPDKYEQFRDFVLRHNEFFYKPLKGGGGIGARVMSANENTIENLFDICCREECLIEEVVKQHQKMNEVFSGAVNTIRVYTLVNADEKPLIMGAVSKFGSGNSVVDNIMSGGVGGCFIDIETGVIKSHAIDMFGIYHDTHPDSGIQFVDFQIPSWDKVIEKAKEGALIANKYNRHVGWDIAIREDGEIEIIEGNSWPDLSLLQAGDCVGKRHVYDEEMGRLAKKMNMEEYIRIPENIINLSDINKLTELKSKIEKL